MTQSDNIKEFLKYASPRLEYIEYCMEKQALSPQTYLKAISKLKNLDANAQAMYPTLKALSESDHLKTFSAMKPKAQLKAVEKVLKERRNSKGLTKSKVPKGWEAPSSKPKPKSNTTKYGDLFDADKAGLEYLTHLKSLGAGAGADARKAYLDTFKSGFLSNDKVVQEATRRGITADALFDEVAKYYASGFRGTAGPNARGLRRLFDDATEGKYYNYKPDVLAPVSDWAKDHPIATPLIAAGATSIPTAGISYAIGNNSGKEQGVANADAYYRAIMEAQGAALRNANGDVLTRLANVFGAGDLDKLIDGYY